jgi:hypothetical protein
MEVLLLWYLDQPSIQSDLCKQNSIGRRVVAMPYISIEHLPAEDPKHRQTRMRFSGYCPEALAG